MFVIIYYFRHLHIIFPCPIYTEFNNVDFLGNFNMYCYIYNYFHMNNTPVPYSYTFQYIHKI